MADVESGPKSGMPVTSSHAADIVVIGGGMAGVMAAVAARRQGCRVLLIEPTNVLGGQGVAGGVAGFCGDTDRVNHLFAELVDTLSERGLIADLNPNADRRAFDLEWCAFALQEMVVEAGVDVLLHAQVVDVVMAPADPASVRALSIAAGDGLMTVDCKAVIDATGRCIAPMKAGLPIFHEGALKQLPMSLYFTLWDTGKPVKPILPAGCPAWDSDDDLPMTTLHPFPSGKVEVKMKVIGHDGANPFGLSQAEMDARRQMVGLIHHLQTKGYRGRKLDTHVLASVSRHIGIREQRRIVGEHLLTEDEVTHGCVFDDAVAVGTYHLDYHWPDRVQRAGTGITTMVEPYHIPLRSLIPKGARNMLVAGRGISGDQMAMSSYRVMATVSQIGLAAGLAAARAVKDASTAADESADVSAIDLPALQRDIEAAGQSLNLSDYGGYLRNQLRRHEFVYDAAPFPQCHASTLVQLRNGRFLAAWFGGTQERDDDVSIWVADRFETRWSSPRLAAKVCDQPHWNPVLFQPAPGWIQLYFKVGPTPQSWVTWLIESRDEGGTWSEPVRLPNVGVVCRGPVKNKPITLADGVMLAPSSLEEDHGQHTWRANVDRSEDGGHTWTLGEVIAMADDLPNNLEKKAGVIQPALWESTPGCVHMLLRSTIGRVCRSDSTDGGRTWSPIYATDLPNNNSGLDVVKLDDGCLAMIYNPVEGDWAARTPLTIALSFDNGLTWPRRLDIETEPGEYSYPALIATPLGMAATYTWKRERVRWWQGSVEDIPEWLPG